MANPSGSASLLKAASVRLQRRQQHWFCAFVTCDVLLPLCSDHNAPLKCRRTGLSKHLCLLAQLCCLWWWEMTSNNFGKTSPLSYGLKQADNKMGLDQHCSQLLVPLNHSLLVLLLKVDVGVAQPSRGFFTFMISYIGSLAICTTAIVAKGKCVENESCFFFF